MSARDEEERAFLHALSTPLSAAIMMVDMMLEAPAPAPDDNETLQHTRQALMQLKELLWSRREVLIKRGGGK